MVSVLTFVIVAMIKGRGRPNRAMRKQIDRFSITDKSAMSTTSLNDDEVKARLMSYTSLEVTEELYGFGKMMIDEAIDRFKSLDAKATAIAAYSIGVITIFVSTQSIWTKATSWALYAPPVSGLMALAAAAFAISSLWLKRFEWFSQDEWIKADCLKDAERLRRYHILTMAGVQRSHQQRCRSKASRIAVGQGLLLASAIVLVLALGALVLP
jgi:hypothetical protein